MDTRAPAVVAVVVTTGPGTDLEATLASLVTQDYEDLSILVLANGESRDVAARVASVAPLAFVKILPENLGYAAAANEVLGTVQGAAFLLLCHDDVRLESSACRLLVEAAYRTNAAVVSPKVVGYEDASALLHVGQMLVNMTPSETSSWPPVVSRWFAPTSLSRWAALMRQFP